MDLSPFNALRNESIQYIEIIYDLMIGQIEFDEIL